MPLSGQSPTILHILQNASLFLLSTLFIPLCTCIAILSRITSPFTAATKRINRHRQWRATSPATFRARTVLVTGVGTGKGLFLARAFYRAGHRVIGADFEPYGVPVCGRFSVALDKFYRLATPSPVAGGPRKYVDDLVGIVEKEKVELWVSCSGVAAAVEDGEAAEAVETLTKCKAIQFGVTLTKILHGKHSFIENTQNLGLNIPDTHLITSVGDAMKFFYLTFPVEGSIQKKYIMKSVGLHDSIRLDMTLLPRPSSLDTQTHLSNLKPSPSRPFVLQQFIAGPKYCTHALIIKGEVLAFVACRSSDFLMHYKALPSSCLISEAMLSYTKIYAKKTGHSMTGHFSIDFLLDAADDTPEKDLTHKIYPIQCNPRARTAVILFADESENLAEAYLSLLPDHSTPVPTTSHAPEPSIIAPTTTNGYYWMGHDLVTMVMLPFWDFASRKIEIWTFLASWVEFVECVLFWRDGTFEVWDPWPAWWLYCGYWPGMFAAALVTRRWWSTCNVSTTKMFQC
jgi:hypothetical protein